MSGEQWVGVGWSIALGEGEALLSVDGHPERFAGDALDQLSVARPWFRWALIVRGSPTRRFRGLKRADAVRLRNSLEGVALQPEISKAVAWCSQAREAIAHAHREQVWIAREDVERLVTSRPDPMLADRVETKPVVFAALNQEQRQALDFLKTDLRRVAADTNEATFASELKTRRDFFDRIEKSPLTEEQARAVVCMDNRVQVIAAAGSGKTSVMVARAAYAIERGLVTPERTLLLAFNKKAAEELQERIADRLARLGIPTVGLRASTFHSFGLTVIGEATGRKPRLAPWLDGGQDVVMVSRIVDQLRDRSSSFRFRWDMFRLLFARMDEDPEAAEPDGYDRRMGANGFTTLNGEVVKSQGERLIADWLFVNGVDYVYEKEYDADTVDAHHSQYKPDFYYPSADAWHEHWAEDQYGKLPESFRGYADAMRWKRQLHRQRGTTLIETTYGQVVQLGDFSGLERSLTELGIELDWNPDRPISGIQPVKHEDLARLIRTFMTHVKSNSHTRDSIDALLSGGRRQLSSFRTRLFLDIYWAVHDEWETRLAADGLVDFEDMLVAAADHLEKGKVEPSYELVMVDEFQDASQARARLVRGLLQKPGRYLLAVGDDWQSINRFAGSDLSVMTEFERWFGGGPVLRLETTFRCPQSICDVASEFVVKNPRQFQKRVRSAQFGKGAPVLLRLGERNGLRAELAAYLYELASKVRAGAIDTDTAGKVSVLVIGRYRFDRDLMPRNPPRELQVAFLTAHGSKGLEADYVVIPNLVRGIYGFPSEVADDAVMDLVMAEPDHYPYAEERRLFYVALTRARREVTLITARGIESPFVVELLKEGLVTLHDQPAGTEPVETCRTCGQGTMVLRSGPHGEFLGCSRFPKCRGTKRRLTSQERSESPRF